MVIIKLEILLLFFEDFLKIPQLISRFVSFKALKVLFLVVIFYLENLYADQEGQPFNSVTLFYLSK